MSESKDKDGENGLLGAARGDGEALSATMHRAWGALMLAHAAWTRRVERRVLASGGMPLDEYDVMLALSCAPGGRLRMGELHEWVALSRSGLTRLVDRLENQGWVRREVCPRDRRAFEAVLTENGEQKRAASWPIYAQAVAEEFGRDLSDHDARVLADLLGRALGRNWPDFAPRNVLPGDGDEHSAAPDEA